MQGTRKIVLDSVNEERDRQDAFWGGPAHDDAHDERDWCSYIVTYLGMAVDWANRKEPGDRALEKYEENMLKVAALAVASLEQVERIKAKKVKP